MVSKLRLHHFLHLLFASWIFLLICLVFFWLDAHRLSSFTEFNEWCLSIFEGSYRTSNLERYFVNSERFRDIQDHLYGYGLGFMVFVVGILFYYARVTRSLDLMKRQPIKIPRATQVLLLVFLVTWVTFKTSLYHYLPLHIDEVFDFIFYTKTNLLTRHTYQFTDGQQWYNNHILYSDLSAVFYHLGLEDQLAIRIPSVLSELGMLCVLFYHFRTRSIRFLVLLLVTITSSFWLSIYSLEGRSYALMTALGVSSFMILRSHLNRPDRVSFLVLLLLSSFGFAASKLYLVIFSGLVMYALLFDPKQFWKAQIHHLCLLTGGSIVLFFLPTFLVGGLQNIYQTIGINEPFLTVDLLELLSFITNIDSKAYVFLVLYLMLSFVLWKKLSSETQSVLRVFGVQLVMYFLFSIVSGDYLPFRGVLHLNVFFCLSLGLMVHDLTARSAQPFTWTVVSCTLLVLNTAYNFQYSWLNNYQKYVLGRSFYERLDEGMTNIMQANPIKVILHEEDYFHQFYLIYHHPELPLEIRETIAPNLLTSGEVLISKTPISSTDYLLIEHNELYHRFVYHRK